MTSQDETLTIILTTMRPYLFEATNDSQAGKKRKKLTPDRCQTDHFK